MLIQKEFSFFLINRDEILNKEKLLEKYYKVELNKVNKVEKEFCLTLIYFLLENQKRICCVFDTKFKNEFSKKINYGSPEKYIAIEYQDPVTYNLLNKEFDVVFFENFDKTVNKNKEKFQGFFEKTKEKTYYLEIIK